MELFHLLARRGLSCVNVRYFMGRLQVMACERPSCASTWRTFLYQYPLFCNYWACFKPRHVKGLRVPNKCPLYVEIYHELRSVSDLKEVREWYYLRKLAQACSQKRGHWHIKALHVLYMKQLRGWFFFLSGPALIFFVIKYLDFK